MVETLQKIFSLNIGQITVGRILSAVLLLAICFAVIRLLSKVTNRLLARYKVDAVIRSFIRPLIQIVLYFVAVLMVADQLGIPISSLLAVFSIAGLAASLAMQDTLSNLASGVLLLVTKPFRPGDYIECSGEAGTVTGISLVYTQLNTPDNRVISVPNKDVAAAKLVNYSANDKRRIDLTFTASYACPVQQVKEALQAAAEQTEGILPEPALFVAVNDYKSSSIEYVVRAWCATTDFIIVRSNLIEKVKQVFDATGVEMTYDHLNVHIVENKK